MLIWDVSVVDFKARDWLGLDDHIRADLVIADPPYNQGVKYDKHNDRLSPNQFVEYLIELADACAYCLRPGGVAAVLMGERFQGDLIGAFQTASRSDDDYRPMFVHDQSIIWRYTFGQSGSAAHRRRFTPSWTMIHVFVKHGGPSCFNADEVMVPSARQTKYRDKRAKPGGKVMDNVWDISRVCGTFKEKVDYPNQLPLELTDRLVKVFSRPGDQVIDPCCGSGTTGVSAVRLGRNYMGIDISTKACELARQRITGVVSAGVNR